jgi:hypothetical protein
MTPGKGRASGNRTYGSPLMQTRSFVATPSGPSFDILVAGAR